MRLIDADALIEELYKNTKIGHYGEFTDGSEVAYTYNEISKAIEEQPTAFDTEKVIEQLESLSNAEADYYYARSNDVIDREDAIDIVKKGGAE